MTTVGCFEEISSRFVKMKNVAKAIALCTAAEAALLVTDHLAGSQNDECRNDHAAIHVIEAGSLLDGITARNSVPCRLIVGHIPKWLPPNT